MSRIRMGMVGGGSGSFIGAVHRIAAELDGDIQLVCGAFASDPSRSKQSGVEIYGLSADRSYGSYEQMFAEENAKPENERMQFVVIATPNHVHFPCSESGS